MTAQTAQQHQSKTLAAAALAGALSDARSARLQPIPEWALSLARGFSELPEAKELLGLAHLREGAPSSAGLRDGAKSLLAELTQGHRDAGAPQHPVVGQLQAWLSAPESSPAAASSIGEIKRTFSELSEQGRFPRDLGAHERMNVFRVAELFRGLPEAAEFNRRFGQHFRPNTTLVRSVASLSDRSPDKPQSLAEVGKNETAQLTQRIGIAEKTILQMSPERARAAGIDKEFVKLVGLEAYVQWKRDIQAYINGETRVGMGNAQRERDLDRGRAPGVAEKRALEVER